MGLNALDPADWLWRDERFARRDRRAPAAARRAAGARCWPMLPEAEPAVRELVAHGPATISACRRHAERRARRPRRAGAGGFLRAAAARRRARYALTAALLVLSRPLAAGREAGPAAARDPRAGAGLRRRGWAVRPTASSPTSRSSGRCGARTGRWSRAPSYSTRSRASRSAASRPRTPASSSGCGSSGRPCAACRRAGPSCSPSARLVRPLGEVAAEPGVARAMAARIREMEPGMAGYKGMPGASSEPLLAWLDAARVSSTPPAGRQRGPGERAVLQPRRALARHDDVGRRHREAVAGIVGGVADQEHQPPAQRLRPGEAAPRSAPGRCPGPARAGSIASGPSSSAGRSPSRIGQ